LFILHEDANIIEVHLLSSDKEIDELKISRDRGLRG